MEMTWENLTKLLTLYTTQDHSDNRHTPNHAALLIGGAFAAILLSVVTASSPISHQIRHIKAFRNAPKPTRILSINNSIPRPKIQL